VSSLPIFLGQAQLYNLFVLDFQLASVFDEQEDRTPIWVPSEESRQQLRQTAYIHVDDESVVDNSWDRLIDELLIAIEPSMNTPKVEVLHETEMWTAFSVEESFSDTIHQQADITDPEIRRALSLCHTRTIQEYMNYTHGGVKGRDSFIVPNPR